MHFDKNGSSVFSFSRRFLVIVAVVYSALGVSCATLLISGEYVRRVIGFLYLSEDGSQVRISRVSFLGRRIDFELPLEDIHPLTDTGQDHRSDIYKIHLEPGCPASKSLGNGPFILKYYKSSRKASPFQIKATNETLEPSLEVL